MMKINRSWLLLGILMVAGIAQAQAPTTATARYVAVNRVLPKCKVVRLNLEGYSLEGGHLTGYLLKSEPQKLVAKHYGEGGRASEEYYFWKGQLFFILRTDWDYEFPLGHPKAPGRESRRQEQFYFQNGKLTKWLSEGNKLNDLTTTAAIRAGQDFLSSARDFLGKVKKK